MSRRGGKRNQTGVKIDSIQINEIAGKWYVDWVYHGSTMSHSRRFDHESLAFQFKHTLIRENRGQSA